MTERVSGAAPAQPVRIGVLPTGARSARGRLLDALECVVPVRFVDGVVGEGGPVAATLVFGANGAGAGAVGPVLRLLAEERAEPGTAAAVDLGRDERLDPLLRGARLSDAHAPERPMIVEDGDVVLATHGDTPTWIRRRAAVGDEEIALTAPLELAPGEALRDRLGPGRCLGVLSVLAFARRVAGAAAWTPPPLRAAFVIDDPNLHWRSYGRIRYRRLAEHAAAHRYHLAVAMIPLDGWYAHGPTAELFRTAGAQLSVTVHGDEHEGPELGRLDTDAAALGVAHRALRRIRGFERRFGVPVSRVMVPPHERLTEPAARALLATGFEAATVTRPYPWIATPERPWLDAPPEAGALAGWAPADIVAGGLPILLRSDLAHPREDLVLKALLGQALILYGHHADIANLDVLAEAAADVNRLGDVRWGPLDELARAGVETRLADGVLHVRPHARRFCVEVPTGIEAVVVHGADAGPSASPLSWRAGGAVGWEAGVAGQPIVAGPGAFEVQLVQRAAADEVHEPRRRVQPIVRRAATELRDRLGGALPAGRR